MTNLAVLRKSRRSPQQGDVFAMLLPDGCYLYGRVISTKAKPLGVPGAILIYIYRARSEIKDAVPKLDPQKLLLPPMMTNRLPWSRGYFETVRSGRLEPTDRLPQHCFASVTGGYFDDQGKELSGPVEPVGEWGLHSYRSIDDEIATALGFPLAPD